MTVPPQSALLRVQLAIAELEAAEQELKRELEAPERPQLRVIAGGQALPKISGHPSNQKTRFA